VSRAIELPPPPPRSHELSEQHADVRPGTMRAGQRQAAADLAMVRSGAFGQLARATRSATCSYGAAGRVDPLSGLPLFLKAINEMDISELLGARFFALRACDRGADAGARISRSRMNRTQAGGGQTGCVFPLLVLAQRQEACWGAGRQYWPGLSGGRGKTQSCDRRSIGRQSQYRGAPSSIRLGRPIAKSNISAEAQGVSGRCLSRIYDGRVRQIPRASRSLDDGNQA